jgi:muramoyltetrapeptide carboxypeptidase
MTHQKKKKIFPPRLHPGDTIGIVAPAGSFERKSIQPGLGFLSRMGFHTFVPENILGGKGYLAGSDEHRAGILNDLFGDKAIKGIFCARGGFGSMKILSRIDYPLIRRNPKIFLGFSDISAILYALYIRCGLVSFHGPVLTTLKGAGIMTKKSLISAVSSDEKKRIFSKGKKVISPGKAKGVVIGGNLTTLCHLIGTPFHPRFSGSILVLEDKGEPDYRIDRMLTQMKLAGCFEGIAGIALGSFLECGDESRIYELFEELFKAESIPILAGFEIGHDLENITIPFGITATLDTETNSLHYHESATADDFHE